MTSHKRRIVPAKPAVAQPAELPGNLGTTVTTDPSRHAIATTLRPAVRVTRVTLFEREVRERLSPAALDLLFAHADVISEGQRQTKAGQEGYFGSTMLTIDLVSLSPMLRDPCDASTARRLALLLDSDKSAAARIRTLAAAEVARINRTRPRGLSVETKVTARGACVHIDIDVEANL